METVRRPATKAVTPKAAVAKYESTNDSTGEESEESAISEVNDKSWGDKLKYLDQTKVLVIKEKICPYSA